jgi:monoamine oxidase
LTNFLGGNIAGTIPRSKLETNLNILNEIYPGLKAQYDGNRAVEHWLSNPWARGSYICPRPGQYTSMHGLAAEPALGGRLIFAGEHASVQGCGFINGAVESGNSAAKKVLTLLGKELSLPRRVQKVRVEATSVGVS